MRLGIKRVVFAMLVLSIFISGDLCAANGANPVRVDGDRLSVHAKGMALGELLTVVEDMTGVQFTFDELIATKEIFLDFEGLPLSEGIKKIIHPLSWATIYDKAGKLRKVIILGRWKGSGMEMPREEASDSPGGPKLGPSDSISFTPKENSHSSGASKGPALGKGPIYPDGPPVDTAHSGSSLPDIQGEIPEGLPVPSVAGSVHLPIPDSKGASVEVPPVGKADSGGTSPDSQDEIPENLPIPGVASSDHVPIPDS
jgi:hypothetical protein